MSTDILLKAYLDAPNERRERALAVLQGRDEGTNTNGGVADRAITRREAARLLACDEHTVSRYGARGLIRRLTFGTGGRRASRYSLASIQKLLAGETEREVA